MAVWIGEAQREQAEISGYTVVDPTSLVVTHLSEVVRRNAAESDEPLQLHERNHDLQDMNGLPDALFVIDVGYQKNAIAEANKLAAEGIKAYLSGDLEVRPLQDYFS